MKHVLFSTLQLSYDIDVQSDSSQILVEWYGFIHYSSAVTFEIGIGSVAGSDDIYAFEAVGEHDGTKLISGLSLSPYQVCIVVTFVCIVCI